MENLKIDALLSFTKGEFGRFTDHRKSNLSISIGDIVQSGLSVFTMKDASLLQNNNTISRGGDNMSNIFKIGERPSDSQMRNVLDKMEPIQIERVQPKIIRKVKKAGVLKQFEFFKGKLLILVDGVHHHSSNTVKCDYCQITRHKDGTVTYSHSMLCAVVANLDLKVVLPFCQEPIINQDGKTKNDCELNASKRLIEDVQTRYLQEKFIFVEDALYANGPHLKAIKAKGNNFIIRIKKDGAAGSVFKQFDALENPDNYPKTTSKSLNRTNQPTCEELKRPEKQLVIQYFQVEDEKTIKRWKFVNGLYLNESHQDLEVNYFHLEETNKKTGKVKIFDWVTDMKLTKRNIVKMSKAARCRWMIENETFNTLKNQGYHFKHNFGHGENYLCTNFANLMMIAFLIDQIQQAWNESFHKALKKAECKKYFWEKMRSYFDILIFESMDILYQAIADGIKINFKTINDSS